MGQLASWYLQTIKKGLGSRPMAGQEFLSMISLAIDGCLNYPAVSPVSCRSRLFNFNPHAFIGWTIGDISQQIFLNCRRYFSPLGVSQRFSELIVLARKDWMLRHKNNRNFWVISTCAIRETWFFCIVDIHPTMGFQTSWVNWSLLNLLRWGWPSPPSPLLDLELVTIAGSKFLNPSWLVVGPPLWKIWTSIGMMKETQY